VVTAETLAERGVPPATAFFVGGEGVREELTKIGITEAEPDRAELVVVGWDPNFDYEALRDAATAARRGAVLIATNADATFPAADGELWPGAGAILAAIERASGARAEVMGKPNRPMMEAVARRVSGARAVAVVGDRPDTDLAGARSQGWTTILVLSGVTQPADVGTLAEAPDHVAADLAALVRGELQ
jgi:HAD superfamily hydrolase (TIGR01450 family)